MLIATAGHVDHGKTVLIEALTGVDTDRLPEEKARGLTIDLGFAYRTLPDGTRLGLVDVPGHEKFLRNMLAGVGAIDHALLVVAADDGPMPQTREHLAILDLLGIASGAVVITKTDRVDAERLAAVRAEIAALVAGTTLAGAPVHPVAALRGEGIPALQAHLVDAAGSLAARANDDLFRLAIDRAFTVEGAGIIVTGAVFTGQVTVGDRLALMPAAVEVRVRAIHANGAPAATGVAGERCALNIAGAGLDRGRLQRGQWLVGAGSGPATARFDARVRVLDGEKRPLAHWTPVHVHVGAAALNGRIALLDSRAIPPGGEGLAQIVVDRPTHVVFGSRFVIRDQSAQRTIAGGTTIDPAPPARRRGRAARVALLAAMSPADPATALARALALDNTVIDLDAFATARNLGADAAAALGVGEDTVIVADGGRRLAFSRPHFAAAGATIHAALDAFHHEHADLLGADVATLARQVRPALLARVAIDALLAARTIVRDGLVLRLPDHVPAIPPREAALLDRIAPHVGPADRQPPVVTELATALDIDKPGLETFLQRAAQRGQLVKVADNRYLHPRAFGALVRTALTLGADGARFTARAYRDAAGIGRNFTIEVLEHFDARGVTRRIGDERVVVVDRALPLVGEA